MVGFRVLMFTVAGASCPGITADFLGAAHPLWRCS